MNVKHTKLWLVVSAAAVWMSMPLVSSATSSSTTACYNTCPPGNAGYICKAECDVTALKNNKASVNDEKGCLEACENSTTKYPGCESACKKHTIPSSPIPD